MNSMTDFFGKIINPVSRETMGRIDYVVFQILLAACSFLAYVWLQRRLDVFGPTPDLLVTTLALAGVLTWSWICATLNRAADTGVTRWGFTKAYFGLPLVTGLLAGFAPSGPTLILFALAYALPTVFLFVWPASRY